MCGQLCQEPDYSKHVEARKPDSSSSDDPEGEESEEETVEVEETDEEEQRSPSAEESSGRGRAGARDERVLAQVRLLGGAVLFYLTFGQETEGALACSDAGALA